MLCNCGQCLVRIARDTTNMVFWSHTCQLLIFQGAHSRQEHGGQATVSCRDQLYIPRRSQRPQLPIPDSRNHRPRQQPAHDTVRVQRRTNQRPHGRRLRGNKHRQNDNRCNLKLIQMKI